MTDLDGHEQRISERLHLHPKVQHPTVRCQLCIASTSTFPELPESAIRRLPGWSYITVCSAKNLWCRACKLVDGLTIIPPKKHCKHEEFPCDVSRLDGSWDCVATTSCCLTTYLPLDGQPTQKMRLAYLLELSPWLDWFPITRPMLHIDRIFQAFHDRLHYRRATADKSWEFCIAFLG